ncbi:hypothetical protein ACH5RR_032968 [Cinchona calisaya]|uniref:Uncharacterized protein n=1 Tax=Cinchona calisaya TaxID=153742 RepID=A0ABD2YKY9_9GENT
MLETLAGFDTNKNEIFRLDELKNLRCFLETDVNGYENLSKIINYIDTKEMPLSSIGMRITCCDLSSEEGFILLRKLFTNRNIHELVIRGSIGRSLPNHESNFSMNLMVLIVTKCEIEEYLMDTLEELPILRRLSLYWKSFMGRDDFPCKRISSTQGT